MTESQLADQFACTETVLEIAPDAAIVSNLGVASWVLGRVNDRDRNFYMRGAMGGTTPTGMGLALTIDEEVVVIDGDGSLLMSLGCLSTVGAFGPDNLTIVVMDNGGYETTGGQPGASPRVSFAGVAESCGIWSDEVRSTDAFAGVFREAFEHDGPALVECYVKWSDVDSPAGWDYGHSSLTSRFRSAITAER